MPPYFLNSSRSLRPTQLIMAQRSSSHTNATQGAIAPQPGSVGSILSSQHRHRHTAALAHVPNPAAHFDTSLSVPVRKYLQVYGLCPPNVDSYDTQKRRCLSQLALKSTDIERFLYLSALRKNNVTAPKFLPFSPQIVRDKDSPQVLVNVSELTGAS